MSLQQLNITILPNQSNITNPAQPINNIISPIPAKVGYSISFNYNCYCLKNGKLKSQVGGSTRNHKKSRDGPPGIDHPHETGRALLSHEMLFFWGSVFDGR